MPSRAKRGNSSLYKLEVGILTEQWELLAEDAKRLVPEYRNRIINRIPTEEGFQSRPKGNVYHHPLLTQEMEHFLQQDFSQSLTKDAKELDQWIKSMPQAFQRYSLIRLEWIEAFHGVVGESDDLSEDGPSFRVPKAVEGHPWWEWYYYLRGMPPAAFPAHLNWRVCLHRFYLSRPH